MTLSGDLPRLGGGAMAAFVALLLARAGLHKLGDRSGFQGVLTDYGLVPETALPPLGVVIPVVEFTAALALAVGPIRAIGVVLAAALLLVYGVAMATALARGRTEIDCGCGGPPAPLSWALVARNVFLAAALIPAGLGLANGRSPTEVGVGWALALAGLACWIACEHAAALHHRMRRSAAPPAAALFGAAPQLGAGA